MKTVHDGCVATRKPTGKYITEIVAGESYGPVSPDANRLQHWCDAFRDLTDQGYFIGVYHDDDIHGPVTQPPDNRVTSMSVKGDSLVVSVKLASQPESVRLIPEIWEHFHTAQGDKHQDVIGSCGIEELT